MKNKTRKQKNKLKKNKKRNKTIRRNPNIRLIPSSTPLQIRKLSNKIANNLYVK